jgi:hypothetical protein
VLALAAVTVIPWVPASPPPPVVPPVARRCRLAQLHVGGADRRAGVFFNGATGSLVGWVTYHNDGRTCSLLGRPGVRLVGGPSATVHQLQKPLQLVAFSPDVLPPPFSTRALPHARTAIVEIWWSNWCASRAPTAVELTLPSGGSVRLKVAHAPRCDAPGSPSTVSVGTFTPFVPAPRPSTRLPLSIGFNRASYRVAAGTVLRYRVVLRNTSRKPFRFPRCPLYVESIGQAAEIHLLNCRPAGTLRPGGSATFAMELRVPKRLRRGRNELFWEVGLGTYLPPSSGAPASVTR